jgi:hypothetical protein
MKGRIWMLGRSEADPLGQQGGADRQVSASCLDLEVGCGSCLSFLGLWPLQYSEPIANGHV